MIRRMVLLLAALSLALPVTTWAQGKPDFSGAWKFASSNPPPSKGAERNLGLANTSCGIRPDEPRPPANCGAWGVPSPTMIITQTPNEVTVESSQYGLGTPQKVVYKLDGSDTIWQAPWVTHSGSSKVVKWRSRARWEGNRLVLYTWNLAERHLQIRDALSLNGGQLTIVRFVEEGAPSTANGTMTYSKGT